MKEREKKRKAEPVRERKKSEKKLKAVRAKTEGILAAILEKIKSTKKGRGREKEHVRRKKIGSKSRSNKATPEETRYSSDS